MGMIEWPDGIRMSKADALSIGLEPVPGDAHRWHKPMSSMGLQMTKNTIAPGEFLRAIELALSREAVVLARKLARDGARLYPDHDKLGQAARVLAPPVVRLTR